MVEDGRITELGSHDELVAAGGSYAALWRSWHGRDEPHPVVEIVTAVKIITPGKIDATTWKLRLRRLP